MNKVTKLLMIVMTTFLCLSLISSFIFKFVNEIFGSVVFVFGMMFIFISLEEKDKNRRDK